MALPTGNPAEPERPEEGVSGSKEPTTDRSDELEPLLSLLAELMAPKRSSRREASDRAEARQGPDSQETPSPIAGDSAVTSRDAQQQEASALEGLNGLLFQTPNSEDSTRSANPARIRNPENSTFKETQPEDSLPLPEDVKSWRSQRSAGSTAEKSRQSAEVNLEGIPVSSEVVDPPISQPRKPFTRSGYRPARMDFIEAQVTASEVISPLPEPPVVQEQPAEVRVNLTGVEEESVTTAMEGAAVERTEESVAELTEESVEAIEQLQNLIFGSKISEIEQVKTMLKENDLPGVRQLLASIDSKLGKLEHQIYDPQELINLLLPWIAEILALKVTESKDDIVNVIVPIIDEVIKTKTQQDKRSMSRAIAELLPEAISHEIQNSPQEVAKALAPEIAVAIREQIRLDQESIAEALAPEMGKAIKAQIELERDAMVDALYPVIGNTIAKYLAEAIRTINEKVSNAFSIEGVQRKIRSRVQGVSEAELILQESIPFTIQAAFLIHKTSGLVIAEAQQIGKPRLESEMVAGMLTAIRSFVNDCIAQSGEVSELNEIEYGDSKIMLEVAGYCYLAVVIKGEPPKEYIANIRETLSTIILKYGKSVEEFEGDPSTIPDRVQTLIEFLMKPPSAEEKKAKFPLALLGVSVVVVALISVPWGIYQYRQSVNRRVADRVASALLSQPELAVYRLGVNVDGETVKLTGQLPTQNLRTQAEKVSKTVAPTLKLDNQILAINVPPDPTLVAAEVKRVTAVLNQIEGVAITSQYREGNVWVQGTVMQMADAQKIATGMKQIPGVQSVVSTVKLNPLKIATRIYFDAGSTVLNPEYQDTILQIKEFLKQYPKKSLRIVGHSDPSGSTTKNQQLAQRRAEAVKVALIRQGVDPKRLEVVGSATPPLDVESHQPLLLSRCVMFEPIAKGEHSP